MTEYIKREDVEKFIEKGLNNPDKSEAYGFDAIEILSEVHFMPTADVVEVRHSYWQCSTVRMSSRDITCRHCHRTETISNGKEDFEYCPHCGARMDGEEE